MHDKDKDRARRQKQGRPADRSKGQKKGKRASDGKHAANSETATSSEERHISRAALRESSDKFTLPSLSEIESASEKNVRTSRDETSIPRDNSTVFQLLQDPNIVRMLEPVAPPIYSARGPPPSAATPRPSLNASQPIPPGLGRRLPGDDESGILDWLASAIKKAPSKPPGAVSASLPTSPRESRRATHRKGKSQSIPQSDLEDLIMQAEELPPDAFDPTKHSCFYTSLMCRGVDVLLEVDAVAGLVRINWRRGCEDVVRLDQIEDYEVSPVTDPHAKGWFELQIAVKGSAERLSFFPLHEGEMPNVEMWARGLVTNDMSLVASGLRPAICVRRGLLQVKKLDPKTHRYKKEAVVIFDKRLFVFPSFANPKPVAALSLRGVVVQRHKDLAVCLGLSPTTSYILKLPSPHLRDLWYKALIRAVGTSAADIRSCKAELQRTMQFYGVACMGPPATPSGQTKGKKASLVSKCVCSGAVDAALLKPYTALLKEAKVEKKGGKPSAAHKEAASLENSWTDMRKVGPGDICPHTLVVDVGSAEAKGLIVHTEVPSVLSCCECMFECLWSVCFNGFPYCRPSPLWKFLGFQSADPATDIRRVGMMGIANLVYLARTYPQTFQLLQEKQRTDPEMEYPLAAVAMNIVAILVDELELDMQTSTLPSAFIDMYPVVQCFPVFLSGPNMFEEIFCVVMAYFDRLWYQMNLGYMGYSQVIEKTKEILEELMQQPPVSSRPPIINVFRVLLAENREKSFHTNIALEGLDIVIPDIGTLRPSPKEAP